VFHPFIEYAMKLLKTARSEKLHHCFDELKRTEHFPGKPWLMQMFYEKQKPATRRAQRASLLKTTVS
jgi:hypothetical protein